MNLDDRLRSAAQALRRDVDARLGDDAPVLRHPPTTHRRTVLLAVAVAVVVVVGAVVVVLQRDGSDRPSVRTARPPSGPPEHFRIGEIPKGMVLQLAADGHSTTSTGSDWTLIQDYIRYDAARDAADGILTVRSQPNHPDANLTVLATQLVGGVGYPVEPVDVRGHPGVRIGPAIAWQESPDVLVAIGGPFDEAELFQIADGLTPRAGTSGFDPQYVPPGYEPLAEHPGASKQTADSIVWYSARSGKARTLKLFVTKDTAVPLVAQLAEPKARLVDVRGHRAVITNMSGTGPGPGQTVSWEERPGLRLQLTGTGFIGDALLAAARSTVPLSDAQWARYGDPHSTLFPRKGGKVPLTLPTPTPTGPTSTIAPTTSEALGLTISLPSGWTLHDQSCPAARTVVVVTKVTAKPLPAGCDHVAGPWVSIQRIPKDLTGIDDACAPGLSDDMPFCQAIEIDPREPPSSLGIERRFYAGLDVLVSLHHSPTASGGSPEFSYASPDVRDHVAGGAYPTAQPLLVAQHALEDMLAGGCSTFSGPSATRVQRQCAALDLPAGATVREVGSSSIGGSVPAAYFTATVVDDATSTHYRLLVQNHWDTDRRWVTQSVSSIVRVSDAQAAEPSPCTTPPTNPRFMTPTVPDCPTRP